MRTGGLVAYITSTISQYLTPLWELLIMKVNCMLSMDCYYKEFVIYLVCVVFAVECCQCSLGIRIFFIDYVEHIVECIPS